MNGSYSLPRVTHLERLCRESRRRQRQCRERLERSGRVDEKKIFSSVA